jgi:Putative phage tail protein
MATIVFATVGRVLGGDVGQAIGAYIGQRVDQKLFGPKGRQGPRLNELSVQSSTYGAPIPKLYGINRIAGTVIWATDLREDRKKVSNGKGQPKSTVYSYSASFAVALSARRVLRVGRIWADGNLLRGAAGDFKTQTGFRLHEGAEDQAVDSLIAAAEGTANAPAYRGLAYAVFENMQLADFGNRIPSLSFEVVADEGNIAVGAILNDLGGPAVAASVPTLVGGFAAYGDSVRGVAEALATAIPFSTRDEGSVLSLFTDGDTAPALAVRDLGAGVKQARTARLAIERRSSSSVPETLTIAHYEVSRDYQQGLQRARRDGGARRETRIDLPLVLEAAAAKAIAEARLSRVWHDRVEAKVRLPWRRLDIRPGQYVAVAGSDEQWRVSSVSLEHMVIEAQLVRTGIVSSTGAVADPGRSLTQPDLAHGPTIFHLIDLPPLDDGLATAPNLVVAAAGSLPGWRRAAMLLSIDGGMNWQEAGGTALPATMGTADTVLGSGNALLTDRARMVDVTLLNNGMALNDADEAGIRSGRNLAMIGNELMQFRSALPLGAHRFRLSGLNRGLRGTEWAMAAHVTGERFILLEADTLAPVAVQAGVAEARVMASGLGDGTTPPPQIVTSPGQALLPVSPVHLSTTRFANGDTEIRWKRRSRDGWRWIDGADAPLGEESEAYRIELSPNVGLSRLSQTSTAVFVYTNSMRLTDISGSATNLTIAVSQAGLFGLSRTASLTFLLN